MAKRLPLLGLVTLCYLVGAGAASADGCPPQTCGITSTQVSGSGMLFVRPSGQEGPLVAYDATRGVHRFQLPRGLLSADGTRYVAVRRTVVKSVRRDVVSLWDVTRRARLLQRWGFAPGVWPVAISADGYRIALQERSGRNSSRFAIFDAARARVLERVELRGAYQAEALSPDARRLYLIHWSTTTYDLRTYDFATRRLRPTLLAEPDEKMTGTAIRAIETRDGGWLLTLYAEPGGMGFVHALDLRTGIAHCIDLPWRSSDFNAIGATALALSGDSRRLYLANPALGRLTAIDVRGSKLVRTVGFSHASNARLNFGVAPNAALTPNGRVLAFSGGGNVWLYDTAYGVVRGPFAAAENLRVRSAVPISVGAVGFDAAGRRLLALTTDRARASFDAATGRRLGNSSSELFSVRASGGFGSLLGYASTGGPRFILPDGRASADDSSYFTALPRRHRRTAIERYSPATGALLSSRVISGRWTLGAVSASGRTIAIARHANRMTWVRVLDAAGSRPLSARRLHGVYTLEAVSDDGARLFMIQHYRGGSYAVRALDLRRGRLWTATLREKGETETPLMTGRAAGQVASPDGRWLLTLYLDTKRRAAFVHALNLRAAYAVCIDLPSRGSLRQLRQYSLALAGDHGVYAANGRLGVLARVDLRRESLSETLRFPARGSGEGWPASTLSRDGRTLYFASGRRVWRYDVESREVRGPIFAPGPVLGLAFSHDGRKVFAAREDGGVAVFDASAPPRFARSS